MCQKCHSNVNHLLLPEPRCPPSRPSLAADPQLKMDTEKFDRLMQGDNIGAMLMCAFVWDRPLGS
jgi:hypothetical protein